VAAGFGNGILRSVRILLATTNKGKIAELKRIMGEQPVDIAWLSDEATTEGIETGSTFEENALLKARYYHRISSLPTIADDSGLQVEALDGAPGIYSARHAGPEASDAERIARLLESMKALDDRGRQARFTCAAAFVSEGQEKVFLDHVPGLILHRARGVQGFGYDPVFFYEPLGKTFAELSSIEKSTVSHRGRAFRRLAAWLNESGLLDTPRPGDRIVATAD
jgi:XTP/dITP diphosphohydrolase